MHGLVTTRFFSSLCVQKGNRPWNDARVVTGASSFGKEYTMIPASITSGYYGCNLVSEQLVNESRLASVWGTNHRRPDNPLASWLYPHTPPTVMGGGFIPLTVDLYVRRRGV